MNDSEEFQCDLAHAQISGELFNRQALGKPIVVVAGGPGLPYDYLCNIATLLANHPVIFYDPAGVGRSQPVVDTSTWHMNHFIDEIEGIRQYFAMDDMVLLGHSAGTMVSLEYTLARPERVGQLILVSPIISTDLYRKQLRHLVAAFPTALQSPLLDFLNGEAVDALEATPALAYFYQNHMYCKPVWPEILLSASRQLNRQMCQQLWGENDFALTGSWQNYDRMESLEAIPCPVLLLSGEHDFITEASCRLYSEYLAKGTYHLLTGVSHNPHLEDPEQFQACLKQHLS